MSNSVTVPANVLKAAYTHVSKVQNGNYTFPPFDQVAVEWNNEMVTLTARDTEHQLTAVIPNESTTAGQVFLPTTVLKAALDGKVTGKDATVSQDGVLVGRKNLKYQHVSDRETLPVLDFDIGHIATLNDTLRVYKVIGSAATDDSRPALASIRVQNVDGRLTLHSADGFRMSYYRGPEIDVDIDVLYPINMFKMVPKNAPVTICEPATTETSTWAMMYYPIAHDIQIVSTCKAVDAMFPDLKQLIPDVSNIHPITLRTSDVAEAATFAKKYTSNQLIEITDTALIVKAHDHDFDGEWNGYKHDLEDEYGFNAEYMAWAVEGDDEQDVHLQATNSPAVIIDGDLTMVLMPMVIGAS